MNAAKQASCAGVLLVGNELLSGRVTDRNLAYLAAALWERGVHVAEAAVVRDEIPEIAEALRRLAARCTWVFTAGGIGPTHDDVTIDGVASAFGVEVVVEPTLEGLIRSRWGDATTEAHLRMARVPRGAHLEGGDARSWPTVRLENVFVLPGVPEILQRKFERIEVLFRHTPFRRCTLAVVADEVGIATELGVLAGAHPLVEFGSYPMPDHLLLTLESRSADALEAARVALESLTADLPRHPREP